MLGKLRLAANSAIGGTFVAAFSSRLASSSVQSFCVGLSGAIVKRAPPASRRHHPFSAIARAALNGIVAGSENTFRPHCSR
jgi:hypothetical protein